MKGLELDTDEWDDSGCESGIEWRRGGKSGGRRKEYSNRSVKYIYCTYIHVENSRHTIYDRSERLYIEMYKTPCHS